jgi:hypothetical protein
MRTIPRPIMTCTWFLRICRRTVGSVLEGVIGFGPQAIWCRPTRSARLELRDGYFRRTWLPDRVD